MTALLRILGITFILLTVATPSRAQSPVDPSGHWEGSIVAPFGEIPIALDLARRDGTLVATFSRKDGSVTGFPLSDVELNGNELKMTLKANGGGVMRGAIAGTTITGTFAAFAGTAPFEVTRTGVATFATAPISTPISRELQGTWKTTLSAGNDSTTFVLTLISLADGSTTASIADDHAVPVPARVVQDGARVTVEIPSARGSFSGTLKDDAIEGTYAEGPVNVPIIFTRVK